MKKYLFLAIAALGLVACADKQDDNSAIQNGELEESYIAINLMSADLDTRAEANGYEDGTAAERQIKTAYFFFFDENGNPFNVTAHQNGGANAPGDGKNHLPLTITPDEENANTNTNVSDISNAVLILNTYKGVYPSKIVAVLNWTPTADKAYSLTELHGELAELGNDERGYVMSNSVYMDGANKMVDAVPLTTEHIKKSAGEATANPIDIYVERIAAKVVLTASGKVDNIFNTEIESSLVGAADLTPVYVKLHGWELFNDYSNSTLLKNIDTTWDVNTLGLTWNDIPYYRCYWTQSQDTPLTDKFSWEYTGNTYPTKYGFEVASSADYAAGTYTYCGENTNQLASDKDYRTKVILKGQLMQHNGVTYEPLELARWYGTEYAGNEELRIAVANSLKFTLYSKTENQYTSIKPEDIECVAGVEGAKAYEVGFQLSTAGKEKTWYKYSSAEGYQQLGTIDGETNTNAVVTNTYLKTVEPALLYANGMTYYIVDIEHLGTAGAKYGVVRNHVYQIDIKSIKGYGSPIYNGLSFIVDQPEYPIEGEASYVAAQINVLSWKIVKQQVNIVK